MSGPTRTNRIPPDATTLEMQTGTEPSLRSLSPALITSAILALAVGLPTRIKTLAADGDYSTWGDAEAGAADWDILQGDGGTYTYDTLTLPAGKLVRDCTLESTNTVNNAAVVTTGGIGCVLENVVMKTAAGAVDSKVAGSAVLTCRNVIWQQQATQGWIFACPMHQWGGQVATHADSDIFTNVDGLYLEGVQISNADATSNDSFFSSSANAVIQSCVITAASASQALMRSVNGTDSIVFDSCILRGTWGRLVEAAVCGSLTIQNCDLNGVAFGTPTFVISTSISLNGNANYGTVPTSACSDGITWDVGDFLVQVVTADYTLKGFESELQMDSNGGADIAITANDITKHGTDRLKIKSMDEHAAPSVWTFTRVGADTIKTGFGTSYVSSQRFEVVEFGLDKVNKIWTLDSIQPPKSVDYFDAATVLVPGFIYYKLAGVLTIAQADAESTAGPVTLWMALGTTPKAGMMRYGQYLANPAVVTWADGASLFLHDDVAGKTEVAPAPSDAGDIIRGTGNCMAGTNDVMFHPDTTYYKN